MPPLVFSIPGYAHLGEDICREIDGEPGDVERTHFPDGERYQRLVQSVENRDVVLVGGTVDDTSTLALYDLACAISKYGARKLSIVVAYFGYSTMERAMKPGEVVTAKTRARLLSTIPPASYGNSILLLDLHSPGIPHYFEGGVTALHVYTQTVLTELIPQITQGDFVLASTDAGRAKWVESLANQMGVEAAFISKRRLSGTETRIAAMNADVSGRTVVIYDDMIRSGGSLISAAEAYRAAGATRLFAVCTHGVFTEGSFSRLRDSAQFDRIVASDSHPTAVQYEPDGLLVFRTAHLFAEHLPQGPAGQH